MSVSVFAGPPSPLSLPELTHPLIHYQCSPDEIITHSLRLQQGTESESGALVISTGCFTGRSPQDKFIVRDEVTARSVDWNEFNRPLPESDFNRIRQDMLVYLNQRSELWVRDAAACASEEYEIRLRLISEHPWSDLFAYNMFLRPDLSESAPAPEWTILCAPGLLLDPAVHGVRQSNAAVISFRQKTILIAGTGYTGEIKKGIFTVLNFLLPLRRNVLSMHCAANMGLDGKTALFFGLSGTGKTTLSADPERQLIGDDEHGWSPEGIFNFEGGCYAKCIDLDPQREPEIFGAIRRGALVENTAFLPGSREIDFGSRAITENTRVSYPLHFISNSRIPSRGPAPSQIFFLTCDAYGVLPPIAKLSRSQAMYQFISGYTAKVAGTETGVREPRATFSACFGAPFLPLHPGKYAGMLGDMLRRNNVQVWMINTGWTGGPYGTGIRIPLPHTRALIRAVLEDRLNQVPYAIDPIFGFNIPQECPGVPAELLQPRNTWADPTAYDQQARQLADLFRQNFAKYASGVTEEVIAAGPR